VTASTTVEVNQPLNLILSSNDIHSTFEIVPGLNSSLFQLSDPYLTPRLQWVGAGTGPAVGTYQVNVRARDGSGNYGPTLTKTVVAANEVSPATYFGNAERGGVYDWSVLTNLSQTIDGLTPVTAVGQTVRWVRDLSPNNNHLHSLDNTVAAPTLQLDSNGHYVLRFAGNAILIADVPFYFPNVSTAFTAIMGLKAAAQSGSKTLLSAQNASGGNAFFVPLQTSGTTTTMGEALRDDSSNGGVFPSLPNILDNTARVLTSKASPKAVFRMRDASLRPTDGSGVYGSSATNTAIGTDITSTRMGIGGNVGLTPTNFYTGDLYPFMVISRDLEDWETVAGEDWVGHRALTATLPGSTFDVNAAGSVGTVAVSAPTGTASNGVGSSSGNGAGSPGIVTTVSFGGQGAGSASASASIGSVKIFTVTGGATGAIAVPDGMPIMLDEAKDSQRIETSDEDVVLLGFLLAAIAHVEQITGKNLSLKTETQDFDGFPSSGRIMRLNKGPVREITEIAYDDGNGDEQILTGRLVNGGIAPSLGGVWPATAQGVGTVRVTYLAGYMPGELPLDLKHAALLLFGHFYANREAVSAGPGIQVNELPLGVAALIQPHRQMAA
jgi:uncharacterized phiE125 gp8 family phage protein